MRSTGRTYEFCKPWHAGIPILVFLTKIDKYDPDVIGEDLTKTFHSARLLSLMEVSCNFFPRVNYATYRYLVTLVMHNQVCFDPIAI